MAEGRGRAGCGGERRFGKPADTIVHQADPFNAEPPRAALARAAVTPVERFYVRSHGSVPTASGRLRIDGLVEHPLELAFDDLRDGRFVWRRLTATLQCAGNRRSGLIAVRDIPDEAPWGPGATGTAHWGGVALADVLSAAGAAVDARHVAFTGADLSGEVGPPQRYEVSIPLAKAMQDEVLLALEMNGAPLPLVHGGPLRVVVPGYIGARSVKWLERVELRAAPSDAYYQSTGYRLLPADAEPAAGAGIPLGEIAVNAAILVPADGASVPAGERELHGYAFAGGERHVARVELSTDGGRHWRPAELAPDQGRWAWRLWSAQLTLAPGRHEVIARAWDSAAATQPEHAASVWNPKGYVNNSWARIAVHATA